MADAYAEALEMARELRQDHFGTDPIVTAGFDQMASAFRATMVERFGVDLDDPIQRRAAFAGAWSLFEYFMGLVCPMDVVAGARAELGAYVQLNDLARI